MAIWIWLNVVLGVLFFGAIAGVPLWMVLKHPDQSPRPSRPSRPQAAVRPRTASAGARHTGARHTGAVQPAR